MHVLQYYLHTNNLYLAYLLPFFAALESVIAPLKINSPMLLMGDISLTKISSTFRLPTLNHFTADSEFILFMSTHTTHAARIISYPS